MKRKITDRVEVARRAFQGEQVSSASSAHVSGAQKDGLATAQEMAEELGVSRQDIIAVRIIRRHGIPEIVQAAEAGKISLIMTSRMVVDKTPEEQRALLTDLLSRKPNAIGSRQPTGNNRTTHIFRRDPVLIVDKMLEGLEHGIAVLTEGYIDGSFGSSANCIRLDKLIENLATIKRCWQGKEEGQIT